MTHQTQRRPRVLCPECTFYLAVVSLVIHNQVQRGVGKGGLGGYPVRTPYLLSIIPQGVNRGNMLCIGVSGGVLRSDQPLVPLIFPPCVGHDSVPGGG